MARVKIKKTGVDLRIAQRELNNINREAYRELGLWFHGRFVHKRFTRRGASELGYLKRRPVTNFIKRKLFGHTKPNVFSGESEQLAKIKDVRPTATKTKAKAKIVLRANKLNLKNPNSQIHPAKEIRRVSRNETRQSEQKLVRLKDQKLIKFASRR